MRRWRISPPLRTQRPGGEKSPSRCAQSDSPSAAWELHNIAHYPNRLGMIWIIICLAPILSCCKKISGRAGRSSVSKRRICQRGSEIRISSAWASPMPQRSHACSAALMSCFARSRTITASSSRHSKRWRMESQFWRRFRRSKASRNSVACQRLTLLIHQRWQKHDAFSYHPHRY